MKPKIVLVELNEVPFRVLDEHCRQHPRSTLARLLACSQQFETYAEDSGHLSPWVTWPSLHRGVSNSQHGIACFGEDLDEANRRFPPVWKLLAEHGVSTGVFGSLHSYASFRDAAGKCAFYVPDTFAAGSECFPRQLSAFQEFNLAMVEDSARNVSRRICWQPALRLLAQAPLLGLKARTLADVGRQLVAERINPARRVRRRTYQAVLAFDLFFKQLSRTQPDFATFFTNHVASAMHRYWAARFPSDYSRFDLDSGWVQTYQHEIDFALSKLDACLARLVRFTERHREYRLWIATSMGQAATIAQPVSTQLYVTDIGRFMSRLRVPTEAWSRRPAMAPDVNVVVSEPAVAAFSRQLERLLIAGRPIEVRRGTGGFFSLRLGQPDLARRGEAIRLDGSAIAAEELGMMHVVIDEQSNTTAYHIPQGVLSIYDPRRPVHKCIQPQRTQISTLEIAPALLREFDVPLPGYMRPARLSAAA